MLLQLAAGKLVQDDVSKKSVENLYRGLDIGKGVADSKLRDKFLALQNPQGKTSDLRAKKQGRSEAEKSKKKQAKIRGNKSRGLLPKKARRTGTVMSWETALGVHKLWLGYMAELLNLDIDTTVTVPDYSDTRIETQLQPEASTSRAPMQVDEEESSPEVDHPYLCTGLSSALDSGFSQGIISGWQQKLSKADYHGCMLSSQSLFEPLQTGEAEMSHQSNLHPILRSSASPV